MPGGRKPVDPYLVALEAAILPKKPPNSYYEARRQAKIIAKERELFEMRHGKLPNGAKSKAKPPSAKVKVGRPSIYKPQYCAEVIANGAKGYSMARQAAALRVAKDTLANWARAHPEFLEALKLARTLAQAYWEKKGARNVERKLVLVSDGEGGMRKAPDRVFNTPLFMGLMKSMFREDYIDPSAFGGGAAHLNQSLLSGMAADDILGNNEASEKLLNDARAIAFMLGRAMAEGSRRQREKDDEERRTIDGHAERFGK